MKKRNLCILLMLILAGVAGQAQPYYGWRLGAGAGGAAYFGDVGYRLNTTHVSWPVYSVQLGRSLGPSLDLELNAAWGRFSASDQPTDWRGNLRTDNPDFARGLRFETRYRTAGLLLQYKFDNGYLLSQYARFGPYLFAGGGITDFAVYGDLQNSGAFDTKLSTRERGADYPTSVLTVPFGAGVTWRISQRLSADVRAGAHYAFTDYLDNLKAGRGNDVYVTAGLALRYHFELGRDKFRAPLAYVGSGWTAPAAVAVSGNRAEPDAIESIDAITPDLDVTPAGTGPAANLPDAFVRGEERVQPRAAANPYTSTGRAIRSQAWDTLQTRDDLAGMDTTTGVEPVDVQLRTRPVQAPAYPADTTPARAARTNPDEAPDRTTTPDAVRSQSQLAADGPYRPSPYGRANGNTPAPENAGAGDARVTRLETQVADLERQLTTLRNQRSATQPVRQQANRTVAAPANGVNNPNGERREVYQADAAPRRDNANGEPTVRERNPVTTQLPVLGQAQPRPNDPATGRKLDSLLTQVAALRARLDSARMVPATARANAPEAAPAAENLPAVQGKAGREPLRTPGTYRGPGAAPAEITALNAMQDQLAALSRSVDRLEKELAASRVATPPKAPALRKLLPYGPLVIYFPLNSAAINPKDQQRLASLVGTDGMNVTAVVQVKGFADQTGNAAYNLELSRRRAQGIRDYLVNSLGVAPERVIVNYFGQAMATRQQANPYDRRVELEVYVE